uniref:Phosphatidylinositol N-acetylglucosaminyltransferase subunit H like n=1 Tax=Tanacetum cinerariifolium TaxID=118510 RepID=A0A6L2J4G5_TANCI|nr:phosphatidylinositol N-acetylglucosaminyltransferase subunit H like [Tanacetum cinerariifolium]
MPAFGVQLETQYGSGRISRGFIPISKILKPVLNECVTPVTCYWCLSLLVRDEDELTLVFKKFRPPLKMLVPIWKALCAATDCEESSDQFQEDG